MITLLPPTGAVGETEMVAVAVVGLVTVRLATVTPAPRMASVVPLTQFVSDPVIVTPTVEPCAALDGLTPNSVGLAGGSTAKPASSISAPVFTNTCCHPIGDATVPPL